MLSAVTCHCSSCLWAPQTLTTPPLLPSPSHNTRVQECKAEVLWFRLDRVCVCVPIASMQAYFACLSTCLTAWALIEYVLYCTPLLTAWERIDETRQNAIAEVKKSSCLFPSEKIHSRLIRVGKKAGHEQTGFTYPAADKWQPAELQPCFLPSVLC